MPTGIADKPILEVTGTPTDPSVPVPEAVPGDGRLQAHRGETVWVRKGGAEDVRLASIEL